MNERKGEDWGKARLDCYAYIRKHGFMKAIADQEANTEGKSEDYAKGYESQLTDYENRLKSDREILITTEQEKA